MAYKNQHQQQHQHSFAIFCALFIITALVLPGSTQGLEIQVGGRLVCSATGNPLPFTTPVGVAGVNVTLGCSETSTLAQALTNDTGYFQISYNLTETNIFDLLRCFVVSIKLSASNCTALPQTGTLQGIPNLVNIVQTALGTVAVFAVTLFRTVLG